MSLDSIVTEYGDNPERLFFFYGDHIRGALRSIMANYHTRHEAVCWGEVLESSPLVQICADLDEYMEKEYNVNALPRQIEAAYANLSMFVITDLLDRIDYLFRIYLGDTHFYVEGCNFLHGSNDMVIDLVVN